ncbi:MAG: hypothetical protein MJY88_05095 [Bacteroidales bacterium]|nr:hypothetical protein [Bacteroidales bacterium]
MIKRILFPILAVAFAVISCDRNQTEPDQPTPGESSPSIWISMSVGLPQTKVSYNDAIDPVGGITGEDLFSATWDEGDKVVAIRWPEQGSITEMAVLTATESGASVVFEGTANFQNLKEGEKFVIVHGDFVMGDSDGDQRALSFPISEHVFEKASGFPFAYKDGQILRNQTRIEFEGQDGTLDCLKEHEYMVADAFVHLQYDKDGNENAIICANVKEENQDFTPEPIVMKHVSTIIRLQVFFHKDYFIRDKSSTREFPLALTLKNDDGRPIFYRYFRMHPDLPDIATHDYDDKNGAVPNVYATDAIEDSEKNPYIRIDFHSFDPSLTNTTATNRLRSWQYGDGYFVVGYFSVASKPIAAESGEPCPLRVSAYTNSHMYQTAKTYKIKNSSMAPGNVIPLTISLDKDKVATASAITIEGVGVTFAPGLVYAQREDENGPWSYGIYENQGEYAGPGGQASDFGEYFVWGSIDPTQAAHVDSDNTNWDGVKILKSNYKDVASLVSVNGKAGVFSLLTKAEVDRVLARAKEQCHNEAKLGYYYYTPKDSRTMHQAPGSHDPKVLEKAQKNGTDVTGMAASLGFWLGTTEQPAFEDQDLYAFLPNAMQLNDVAGTSSTIKMTPNGYFAPEYSSIDATGDDDRLKKELDVNIAANIMKFSTHTCAEDPSNTNNAYRLQIWIAKNRWDWSGLQDDNRTGAQMNNTNAASKRFARPIRPVIF